MASSPFEMRFGRPLQHLLKNFLEFCEQGDHDSRDLRIYKEKMSLRKFQLLEDYNVNFKRSKQRYLKTANKRRIDMSFEIGDCVLTSVDV